MGLLRVAWQKLNRVLSRIENWASRRANLGKAPCTVFILGPPRSGSTLLFQVLASGSSLGYFTNLSNVFFGFPGTVAWVLKLARNRGIRLTRFSSILGMGRGILEPSEAGSWWRLHIRDWSKSNLSDGEQVFDSERFLYSLQRMSRHFDNTLLVKNLYVVDYLPSFLHLLPDSFFIVIRRDLMENAQSLANADLESLLGSSQLFSTVPPGVKMMDSEDHESFARRRILATHQHIDAILKSLKVPESRICRLDFELLKSKPFDALSQVAAMLQAEGKFVRVFADRVPNRFD